MKRKLLTVFSILLSLIGILAIFAACGDDDKPANVDKPSDHAVTEEYYYDANGTEYLISLRSENYFTYSIAGDQAEGTYKLENGTLTLTPTEGAAVSGTVSNNVLNLTYKENPYTFRLKVNYTVRFDTKGGSAVSSSSVLNGKTVAKPQDPTKTGETFVGWYMDEACHNAYSFSQRVTSDLTLYAQFVAPVDPEFTVSFAGEGTDGLAAMTTVGNKLFNLPTPQKEGAEFVGWYVSQSGSPTKLSYKYSEQLIEEDITLYAVYDDGSPVVSVSESGVTVENLGVNQRYTVSIVAPNNSTVKSTTSTDRVFNYDFTALDAGEYTVTVVLNGKSTVRYFSNKTLAHVTVFKVTGYTLSFNGVQNATRYLLNATCASGHTHSNIEIDPNTRSWSFEKEGCELPIDFTVTAVADGYASSVSKAFNFTRTLDAVKGVVVGDDTSKVTWGAVENATSYYVSVTKGGDEVLGQNVGNVTTFDLSGLDPDTYTVQVKPVARGWLSPDATSAEYNKARLATPQNITYHNDTVSWGAVKGAASYTVVIDGVEYKDITDTSVSLAGKLNGDLDQHTVTVRALPAEGYIASFDSAEYRLTSALSKPNYKAGILSWNAVEGVNSYVVTVDGASKTVTGNTYKVTFARAGSIFLSVSAVYDNGSQSAPQEISVTVYALTFDMNKEGEKPVATLYLAEGDPYEFPADPSFTGNTFVEWRSAPTGGDAIDKTGDKTYGLKQDCTYYANWAARKYTLSFDAGRYGTMAGSDNSFEIEYGATQDTLGDKTLPVPTVTDSNRAFVGWHLVDDTGVQITDAEGKLIVAFTQADNVTLHAEYVTVFEFHEAIDSTPANRRYVVTMGPGLTKNIVTKIRIPYQYGTGTVVRMEGFTGNKSVTSVEMPNTIEVFDGGDHGERFSGFTALESITVYNAGAADPVFSSDQGVLYYQNSNTSHLELVCCPIAKSGELTIPENVQAIAYGAFYKAAAISKVTVAGKLVSIHAEAFVDCTSLGSIEFSEVSGKADALKIEDGAFKNCGNLTEITLPAYLDGVTGETFKNLSALQAFKVAGEGDYSAIDGYLCKPYEGNFKELIAAPAGKMPVTDGQTGVFTVPSGIASIGQGAFAQNKVITDVVFPGWVQNIGKDAFRRVTGLKSITFKEGGTAPLTIGETAFYSGTNDNGSDMNTNSLVTELTLPSNLQTIEKNAFGRFRNLKTVTINADSATFTGFSLANNAFVGIDGNTAYVEVVNVGAKCKDFTVGSVFGGKVKEVNIDPANPNFKSVDGVVYDTEMTEIKFFPKEYVGPNGDGSYTVPNGMTAIAASMFANVTTLTSVTIPASVTEIGASAFEGCRNLKSVTFLEPEVSDNTEIHIGARAFFNCYALQQIKLPSRLYSLGMSTFCNCSALTSIELPAGLADIDVNDERYDLFNGCDSLASVTVAEGNTNFSTGDKGDVLYRLESFKLSPDGETKRVENILLFVLPNAGGTITVPGTVRTVAKYAFKDIPHVTEVIFENAVPRYDATTGDLDTTEYNIAEDAFNGQNNNELVDEFGEYNTSLKKVVLPEGLQEMRNLLLHNLKGLETVVIPTTVTSIQPKAIFGCWNINSLIFTEGGSDPLVIEDAEIGDTIVSNGSTVRPWVSLFTQYDPPTGSYIGTPVLYTSIKVTDLVLPSRTVQIGSYAFYGSNLQTITFEGGKVASGLVIHDAAFQNCYDLMDFAIPEGTTEIGASVFDSATISEITLPDSLTKIGGGAFMRTQLTKVQDTLVIPAGMTEIGKEAFRYLGNIKTVDLSAATGLAKIGERAFAEMSDLERVIFTSDNAATPAALADGATPAALAIDNYVFSMNPSLTSVVFPANVSTLGTYVFEKCITLASVTFATYKDGDKAGKSDLKSIGDYTFTNTGLESIRFPESTADELKLGKNMFLFCPSLAEAHISSSVHTIDGVFTGCGTLQTVTVAENSEYLTTDKELPVLYDSEGKSVKYVYKALDGTFTVLGSKIDSGAFGGQTGLTKVIISHTVMEIGDHAFKDCINLETVEFESGSSLNKLGNGTFMNCYALKSINLEVCTQLTVLETGGNLSTNATSGSLFYHCNSLKSLTLPSSIKTINNYALSYGGYESVDLSACKDLTTTGSNLFYYCTALKEVKFPSGITTLGSYPFAYCTSLEKIDLSAYENITKTAANMFDHCSSLTDVKLPRGITELSGSTFNYCSGLKVIDLSPYTELKTFGDNVFAYCGSLREVYLPENITYLGKSTFNGCTALRSIDFSNTHIEHIGTASGKAQSSSGDINLFQNCTNLETVRFPEGLKSLGHYVFRNTTNLKSIYIGTGAANDLSSLESLYRGVFVNSGLQNVTLSGKTTFTTYGSTSSAFYGTFENCVNLKKVVFTDPASLTTIPQYMFHGCSNLKDINFSEMTSLSSFGVHALQDCTSLEEVDLSNTKIQYFRSGTSAVTASASTYIFAGCTSLRTVKLPAGGITEIGAYTFQDCTSLETIENLDISAMTRIGDRAFENCPAIQGEIVLNNAITVFGVGAFRGCSGVTGYSILNSASPTKVTLACDTTSIGTAFTLSAENGLLIADSTTGSVIVTPQLGTTFTEGDTLKLPDDFKLSKFGFAYFNAEGVKKLDLSNLNITSIPDSAFQRSSFEEIILPATVTSIGKAAFAEMTNLRTVTILEPTEGEAKPITITAGSSSTTATSYGAFAFSSIENITFLSRLTTIANYTFYGCTSLTGVDLSGITTIGTYAFNGSGLTELTVPASVTSVGGDSFAKSKLQSVKYEGNPTVGTRAFQYCEDLKTIDFGPRTTLGTYEFEYSGLETVTIPATITAVANYAFAYCPQLTKVVFEGSMEKTANWLFQECTNLTEVTLPEGLTEICQWTFQNCTSLKWTALPDTLKTIGSKAYEFCTGLTGDIVIPESVTSIGTQAFDGCVNVNSITLSATVGGLDGNSGSNPTSVFMGWTADQTICFRNSSFEVAALCRMTWLNECEAKVVYDHKTEA